MILLFPFPDVDKSLECLPKPELFNFAKYKALFVIKGHVLPERADIWRYHFHFLASAALKGLEITGKKGHPFPTSRIQLEAIQKENLETGPPEWWGDSKIHDSHKLAIDLAEKHNSFRGYWDHREVIVEPKVDIKQRLKDLQPIIKQRVAEKERNK